MNLLLDNKQVNILAAVLSIIFGALIALLSIFSFDIMLDIIFAVVGIGIILINIIPLYISYQLMQRNRVYMIDFIFSLAAIILGALFIFEHNFGLSIAFCAYLLVMSLTRILLADNKLDKFKKQIPTLIVAVMVGFNIYQPILRVALIVVGGLLVVLGIANIILALIKNKNNNSNDDFNDFFGGGSKNSIDGVVIDAKVKEL